MVSIEPQRREPNRKDQRGNSDQSVNATANDPAGGARPFADHRTFICGERELLRWIQLEFSFHLRHERCLFPEINILCPSSRTDGDQNQEGESDSCNWKNLMKEAWPHKARVP